MATYRHSGHESILKNILFMEKAFTEKHSKQNLRPPPSKEQFLFPASANRTDCIERTNLRTPSPESFSSAKQLHMLNDWLDVGSYLFYETVHALVHYANYIG